MTSEYKQCSNTWCQNVNALVDFVSLTTWSADEIVLRKMNFTLFLKLK